jgi:hypothetical protein
MDLEGSLRSIYAVADLPQLIAALGHQPTWEAVPDDAWTGRTGRTFKVAAVGKTGTVPWFAFESSTPERDAATLARHISRRGRVALVLALCTHTRRLAIAVAFDRSPGIELDLCNPDRESLASLARLVGGGREEALGFAARAAGALSAEPAGLRFFREFRATLDRMAAGLPGPIPPDDRHGIVLLQLTRVLFLYFIQAKGWLGGRDRFLAEEVDRCLSRRRRIHRDLLRPLFFGTLNQPQASRSATAQQFGALPYLNGGLFEPHPLDRRYRSDIPNQLWCGAFDGLFERFNFTVAEGRQPGSIAPDMLGRVFEGVMAPEVRHASGTFYTPALLVERLLEAALLAFLVARQGCREAEAERRLRDPDPGTIRILRSITLLDPAVGSGAFLLRALDRLSTFGPIQLSGSQRKRRVLQRNLFGVDRNAAAVRLTELRLWLAVIAEDPANRPDCVSPLPNLDCLIRQGDSLFDPVGLQLASGNHRSDQGLVAELSTLRREVISAAGATKRTLARQLREVEARAFTCSLDQAEQRHRAAIAECLQQGRTNDLFGRRRGLDRELRGRVSALRLGLRALHQARRRLAREGEVPWFHYQTHFADVFARGGFDLVVGNPPWLRSESVPAELRKQLSGRYRWWRSQGQSYGNHPDLAVAFLERAVELCIPGGVVAMLVPAKIATAGYGAAARHALASTTTLHVLADLTGTAAAAFDATVYPLALVLSNSNPPPNHRVAVTLPVSSGLGLRQYELRGGGPWILTRTGLGPVLTALERDHPALGEMISCHLGLKTGLNRVFLNPPNNLEPEVLRWAIRGRDLRSFRCRSVVRLLWSHDTDGRPLRQLPPIARAYLDGHDIALRARRDYRGGPAWTVFRVQPAVARYRVVWSDLARRLTAAALTSRRDLERIPLNSCYVAPVGTALRAHALSAWLNATWIGAVARGAAVPASGGFARFNARVLARLPLPLSALDDPALAQLARAARMGAAIQNDLDQVVARHLGLSVSAQKVLRAVVDCGPFDSR